MDFFSVTLRVHLYIGWVFCTSVHFYVFWTFTTYIYFLSNSVLYVFINSYLYNSLIFVHNYLALWYMSMCVALGNTRHALTAKTWWRGYRITWKPFFLVQMGTGIRLRPKYNESIIPNTQVLKASRTSNKTFIFSHATLRLYYFLGTSFSVNHFQPDERDGVGLPHEAWHNSLTDTAYT